jgi:hypothetical protein
VYVNGYILLGERLYIMMEKTEAAIVRSKENGVEMKVYKFKYTVMPAI